jgi:hypothetical protein
VGHRLHAARLTELRARGPDHVIAAIADEQFGMVARRQLLLAGLARGAIQSRVRRSGLHPLYPGVYAVGHRALMPMAREMAALLACGPGAVSATGQQGRFGGSSTRMERRTLQWTSLCRGAPDGAGRD